MVPNKDNYPLPYKVKILSASGRWELRNWPAFATTD